VAGAAAGAIKGAAGTPDQTTDFSKTSTKSFAPASQQELELQQQSLENFNRQLELLREQEAGQESAQALQAQARGQAGEILGGGAFALTPQEQERIQAVRQATVAQGEADINRLLDERLKQLTAGAAERGVRGQALSQLETGALQSAAEEQGRLARQANITAAEQALQIPQQRISAQQPLLAQGLSFGDQLRQQAIINRQAAQNPFLLQMLNRERLFGGTERMSGQEFTPGQSGDFGSALLGGLAGAGAGIGGASDILGGLGSLKGQGLGDLFGSGSPTPTTTPLNPNAFQVQNTQQVPTQFGGFEDPNKFRGLA
jgi:hypothetical protein